ncbi:imprinted and ancient [Lentinula aff. detonsa]|uniref:Imprinted and ancient n=1 Tax=Lentinula aff. detonsa TaxID=2804958 RepID=A0AA38KHR9_9AGAR|nr:imprinted and ancient [Lentinula aff. detonsa]KAJ3797557.1 imprinted and ancient [Lentinula aff. detonsa]
MVSSRPSSPRNFESVDELIEQLLSTPEREVAGSELEVLKSIYGDEAIRSWKGFPTDDTIRFEVAIDFPAPYNDVTIRILISLLTTYPAESPPQLQLLSRYIGAFGVDSSLFGSVLRTFISTNGVEWTEGAVCVFDGLQNVLDRCVQWYEDHLSAQKAGELLREDALIAGQPTALDPALEQPELSHTSNVLETINLPSNIQIFEAESIVDRKSAFVGRACSITDPSQVPLILSYLSSDRQIARAAHPTINAWRCQVGKIVHQDNDDDGETAAGGRLSHLLQILELNNVLVIVTRYFGGIHLGPDRFKHINQAARNALEIGGFLDEVDSPKKSNPRGGRKH